MSPKEKIMMTPDEESNPKMCQLYQKLMEEQNRNDELNLKVEKLQVALESADINYELFKQKCMMQFQSFQEELMSLKNNSKNQEANSQSMLLPTQHNELKTLTNCYEENSRVIEELDLRLQIHENTKYNGRILWKIDEFHLRRQQVLGGEIDALHSAPCFTSEYGYKFCLRVYLDGDGAGSGTHLSLFLIIMKSEHDRILEWPFQRKVKMTLINQQNRKRDYTVTMSPNKDSASFQKPKSEMNIASGSPLFIRLDRLEPEGFLKEDMLFFDVAVE